ncbi:RecB family exonuclease [Bacillus toyonensis]|uniref:RecB family exonuclease n=1 Tax=Bacillus toyonensis TaxID=155322 RepID=UPI00124C2F6B|nr:PD-(D/E)XK nuclease family protein [Bacillus toyonensis]KAB2380217.1 PD-(D/E)XK nuclease family protein [Bacillus toyonensis]
MKYPLSYYSYSQLSSFISCPYTWYSTYVLKQRSGNKFTALGGVLHTVFEFQGRDLLKGVVNENGHYMKMFNELYFDNEKVPKNYFESKEEYIAMYKKGITAIENYLGEYHDSKPLLVEKKFKEVLIEGTPSCLGFIDRIDGEIDKPWELVVTDYKSGSNPKSKQFLNEDFQLAIYAQALYEETGFYPAFLRYYHPVIAKFQTAVHLGDGLYEYDYKGQRSPKARFFVPEKMAQVKETVKAISLAYKHNNFAKKADKFGCSNCFHKETCKPFGDGTGWNSL